MAQIYEPVEGITVWVDGGIHLKTRDPHDDPIEMGDEEALALASLLQSLVAGQKT